jgi:hypothetical protein
MKKQLLAFIGLALLLATTSAYAQTITVKANVPFDFIVGRSMFPAGQYTVQSIDGSALSIGNSDLHTRRIVLSRRCQSIQASDKTKLVFHRYGNSYFLSQIWAAGDNSGHELPKSARELEVARTFAVQDVILLAALR